MLFTKEMKARIIELVTAYKERLFPSSHTHNANSLQIDAWNKITELLCTEYPANAVTTKQVKECFKNLKRDGKAECVEKRRLIFFISLL